MEYTLKELTELSQLIKKARKVAIESGHTQFSCNAPYLSEDGKTYRLEPKPKGRREVLEKNGFFVEYVKGIMNVRVNLGVHGIDHLCVNPETKEVYCKLCGPKKKE